MLGGGKFKQLGEKKAEKKESSSSSSPNLDTLEET